MSTGNRAGEAQSRSRLTGIAENEIGVRERSGNNDGPEVEAYLAVVKLKKGDPWCAAFLSWVFARAGFQQPRSGWSPDLFPSSRLTRTAQPGDVIGIYFPELKRIAHVGLVIGQKGEWIYSTEGNTTVAGNLKTEGVFKKIRHIRTIHRISDWVTERRKFR